MLSLHYLLEHREPNGSLLSVGDPYTGRGKSSQMPRSWAHGRTGSTGRSGVTEASISRHFPDTGPTRCSSKSRPSTGRSLEVRAIRWTGGGPGWPEGRRPSGVDRKLPKGDTQRIPRTASERKLGLR